MKKIMIILCMVLNGVLLAKERRIVFKKCSEHGQLCQRWDETIGMCTRVTDIRGNAHLVCARLDRDQSSGDYNGTCHSCH